MSPSTFWLGRIAGLLVALALFNARKKLPFRGLEPRNPDRLSHAAAVAGRVAIRIHGLRTLALNIQDAATNATRFYRLVSPAQPISQRPPG